jgi:hypothetical protein
MFVQERAAAPFFNKFLEVKKRKETEVRNIPTEIKLPVKSSAITIEL